MGYDLVEAMTVLAREKHIDFDVVVDTIGASMLAAARKKFPDAENISYSFNKKEGEIVIIAVKAVVEGEVDPVTEISLAEAKELDKSARVGDEMEIYLDHEGFGRNAIASAKQVLMQKVREAERERVYGQYIDRVGKLVSGTVQRVDKSGILINLGDAEAFLPGKELIPKERYRVGDRTRAIITAVDEISRDAQITLSRISDDFLRALFELEVPEIYERVIEIKAIAREPGERAKVSVSSIDERIDPIGACVGIKGVRVQSIVRELNNERIDIILHTNNSELFVTRSLAPAKVTNIDVHHEQGAMTVAVEDEKLSLAIGRGGQNARLASRLTGWKINILPDSEYSIMKRRQAEMMISVGSMDGVGPKLEEKLVAEDIASVQDLADCSVETLTAIEGVGEKKAQALVEQAREMAKKIKEEALAAAKEEVEATRAAKAEEDKVTDSDSIFSGDFVGDEKSQDAEDNSADNKVSDESSKKASEDEAEREAVS